MKIIYILIVLLLSCDSKEHGHAHASDGSHIESGTKELGSHVVTQWTPKSELFMEYTEIIKDQDVAFIVHLTKLADFQPIRSGKLICTFTSSDGSTFSYTQNGVLRDGIFKPVLKFKNPGIYEMSLQLESSQLTDIHLVKDVYVYPSLSDAPDAKEEDDSNQITFLKEQQWKIKFDTETVQKRFLSETIDTYGILEAKPDKLIDITAPVNGLIFLENNPKLPQIGQYVRKGDVLAVLSSPAFAEESFQTIINRYQFAKSEFERAKTLYEKQAIPEKKFELIQQSYLEQKAAYQTLQTQASIHKGKSTNLYLTSQIDGYIESIDFRVGQNLARGKTLFTIVNTDRLILKANVASGYASTISDPKNAHFKLEGQSKLFSVEQLDGSFLSMGKRIDPKNYTLPVLFEFKNPDNAFKIGTLTTIALSTGKTKERLSVSNNAVYTFSGLDYVYVQVDGEHFVERLIRKGITSGGFTEILDGVKENEHVATTGSYQIRLASLKTSEIATHGH